MNRVDTVLRNGVPAAVEIEKLVLGAMLLDANESLSVALDLLTDADFSISAHAILFNRITAMNTASEPVDFGTVGRALHERSELERVGGLTYVTSLTDGLPKIFNLDLYCEKLREQTRLREALFVLSAGVGQLSAPGATMETIREIQAAVASLELESQRQRSGFQPIADIIANEADGGVDSFLAPPAEELGIGWPLRSLTELTGGFQPGNVTVVGAGTGQGKTTIATQCALYAARLGHCVAILTPEMTAKEIAKKMIAQNGPFRLSDWLRGHPSTEARPQIQRSTSDVSKLPIFIDDRTDVTPSMLDLAISRLRRTAKPALLVIDYVQLLDSGIRSDRESRQQHVASISRSIKKLAKKHTLAVLLLTQLNDEGKVREARDIANDATNLLILNNKGHGNYEAVLQKGRFSALQRVALRFDGATGLFSEATECR